MSRHLLHRPTGELRPYPRQDVQPVAGLDRAIYHVLQDVNEPQPLYDLATQMIVAADPVITITDPDSEDVNGTVTYGWLIEPLPPPPTPADWLSFAGWLYQFPPIAAAMDAARLSTEPQGEPATTGLPTALDEARLRQNYPAFSLTWGLFLLASGMPPEALGAIIAKAAECNLPAEFLAALQPEPTP
jgi:hypothetical protein